MQPKSKGTKTQLPRTIQAATVTVGRFRVQIFLTRVHKRALSDVARKAVAGEVLRYFFQRFARTRESHTARDPCNQLALKRAVMA